MENERDLILRAQGGDRDAFGRIVMTYQARLRAFAARFVHNSDDVFDIVQDTFVSAFTHLETFDAQREFGPWIRTICKNRVMSFFRARKDRRPLPLAAVDGALEARISREGADDRAGEESASERVRVLRECVGKLSPPHRELVEKRYGEGTPIGDIAEGMRRTYASVAVQLMRIRKSLVKCAEAALGGAE